MRLRTTAASSAVYSWMPITEPRKGASYDSALRPLWSSPSAKTFSPQLGPISHRFTPGAKHPATLFDTKKNLTRSSTFYSLPPVERYKNERGGGGACFGPHGKAVPAPRFGPNHDITRNAFLSHTLPDPDKVRMSTTSGRGTTFGPGLGKRVRNRELTSVNMLTSNAFLNYGSAATAGSDRCVDNTSRP